MVLKGFCQANVYVEGQGIVKKTIRIEDGKIAIICDCKDVEGFEKFDEYYKNGYIDKIFTTNLIYNPPELLEKEWYCNVNMAKYIALLIDTLNCDNSISNLLNPIDRIKNIVAKYKEEK